MITKTAVQSGGEYQGRNKASTYIALDIGTYSEPLVMCFGPELGMFIWRLLGYYNYAKRRGLLSDDHSFYPPPWLGRQLGISEKQVKKLILRLEQLGILVKMRLRGIPPHRHYALDAGRVTSLVQESIDHPTPMHPDEYEMNDYMNPEYRQ